MPTSSFSNRMEPNPPTGSPRVPTPEGHRNGPCSVCDAKVGENCRCRSTGKFMSGVHEPRKERTERTGAALLTRKEMRKLGYKKGYSSSSSGGGKPAKSSSGESTEGKPKRGRGR